MELRKNPRLAGKTAVVTGGAQGLGEALCIRLAEEGANVVVADLKIEQAQAVAAALPNALAVPCDVSGYAACEALAAAAKARFGDIDILVSNAAILLSGAVEELDADRWKKVIDINLCGCYNVCKAFIAQLKATKGCVVQINSKSGKKGSFKNSAYAASKFGGIGLVQSLALEFAPDGVRVNAICPGNLLNSPLWVDSLFKQYAKNQGITEEQVRQKYLAQVPLGRSCEYDDIANVMIFLASEDASYMTGQAINVTGGQQMD